MMAAPQDAPPFQILAASALINFFYLFCLKNIVENKMNRRHFLIGTGAVFTGSSLLELACAGANNKSEVNLIPQGALFPLEPWEDDFATAAIAIDTLWGGNYLEETGEAHQIVDCYCSGKQHPIIGPPDLKALFITDGVKVTDKSQIKAFLVANQLEERLGRLHDYASNIPNRWRKEYFSHLLTVLETQLNLRLNLIGEGTPVSDEQAYLVAMGREPHTIDASLTQEKLFESLKKAGIIHCSHSTPRDNYRMANEWQGKGILDTEGLTKYWPVFNKELNQQTRERILPYLPAWVADIPEDSIDFKVITEKVHYSGINLALHTLDEEGRPVYKSRIRVSDNFKKNPALYKIFLVAHEGRPGHNLQLPIHHGLYARGEHGFETTLGILCSPGVTLDEGIADSAMDLLYGPIEQLSGNETIDQHLTVAYHLTELNAFGRNNVAVRYLQGEKDPAKLAELLHKEYYFSEEDAGKYVNNWLFHERMGKLLGLMYLPAYGVGREVVKSAIETYGREAVIPVIYGTRGQVDVISFPKMMKEEAKKEK